MHVRKRIRAALKKLLVEGVTLFEPANVFEARVHTIQEPLELPALNVALGDEDVTTYKRTHERNLEAIVEAIFKDRAALEDKLEDFLEEIEKLVGAAGADLGGAKSAQLTRVEVQRDGDGETPAARVRVVFVLPYYSAQGAPDLAL